MSSNSAFQLKFQPLTLETNFKSGLLKRITSVMKLSPEIVFNIESVSLSIMKSCSKIIEFFILQSYKKFTRISGFICCVILFCRDFLCLIPTLLYQLYYSLVSSANLTPSGLIFTNLSLYNFPNDILKFFLLIPKVS